MQYSTQITNYSVYNWHHSKQSTCWDFCQLIAIDAIFVEKKDFRNLLLPVTIKSTQVQLIRFFEEMN